MKSILMVAVIAYSCSKDSSKKNCYECQLKNSSEYIDFGCMTETEWDQLQPMDNVGNEYNKNKCREKMKRK